MYTHEGVHVHMCINAAATPIGLQFAFITGESLLSNMVNSGLLSQRPVKAENHSKLMFVTRFCPIICPLNRVGPLI